MTVLLSLALADDLRHLERRAEDFWVPRDAQTREALDPLAQQVQAWLDWEDQLQARPRLADHVQGVSVWIHRNLKAGTHEVQIVSEASPWPGRLVDTGFEMSTFCALLLSGDGTRLLYGRSADDSGFCHMGVASLVDGPWASIGYAQSGWSAWTPNNEHVVMHRQAIGAWRHTQLVSTDGYAYITPLWTSRRATRVLFTDEFVVLGDSRTNWNGRSRRTRVVQGPIDQPEWTTAPGNAQIIGVDGDDVLLQTDALGYPALVRWRDDQLVPLTPARDDMNLVSGRMHQGTLLAVWSQDGLEHLEQRNPDGSWTRVDLGPPAVTVEVFRSMSEGAIVRTSSPTHEHVWIRQDGQLQALDGSWDDPAYQTLTLEGGGVPITWVGPREPGAVPTLGIVYGGFGVDLRAHTTPDQRLWLAAGGGLAFIHARGGAERGHAWHQAAVGPDMAVTFEDVVAASAWLKDQGWASSLALHGHSNGGLSVAGALLRAPELFDAAVGSAGVYDLLRGHRFGRWWPDEYGHPRDRDQRAILQAESPVHQVPAALPPLLLVTAQRDPIVDPAHTWKLMAAWEDPGPVSLLVDVQGSHAPSKQVAAFTTAFLLQALGLEVPPTDETIAPWGRR